MIHPLSLGTHDTPRAASFYDAVTASLGMRLMKRRGDRELIYGASAFLLSVIRPVDGRRPLPATAPTWPSPWKAETGSMPSTAPRPGTAGATLERPASATNTIRTTTAPSSPTPTATSWKPSR